MTDVQRSNASGPQTRDQRRLGWIGKQRELACFDVHQHAAFLADGPQGEFQHVGHHMTEFFPPPPGDNDQRVTVAGCLTQGCNSLWSHIDAVIQRSVDVDGDDHFVHASSYPVEGQFEHFSVSMGVRSGTRGRVALMS